MVRIVNRHRILDRVRAFGTISRADLAKMTSIRPPTVSAVIRQLIAEGLVEEVGQGESKTGTGRPPIMVSLSRGKARMLGFEVSGTTLRAGACDLHGKVLADATVAFGPQSPEETAQRMAALGEEVLSSLGLGWRDMLGVGVALPGLVDTKNGLIRWSRPLGWRDVRLQEICEAQWARKTDVVNNAVAGGMAEHFFGDYGGCKTLVYLHIRFDVVEPCEGVKPQGPTFIRLAGGVIVDGEPYHGDFGAAGEISSLVPHPLQYMEESGGPDPHDTFDFEALFTSGDARAIAALDRSAQDIQAYVMHAINFLDPGVLVIDSDHPDLRNAVLARVKDYLAEDTIRAEVGETRVLVSTLGKFGMVRGAVVPALQRVFRLPRLN